MHIKPLLIFILVGLLTTCGSANRVDTKQSTKDEKPMMMWAGIISEAGFTYYQYGTHQLKGSALDGNPDSLNKKVTFALKSNKVDLNKWIGKDVIITGTKVKGYPVEGGPDFIDVIRVEKNGKVKAN